MQMHQVRKGRVLLMRYCFINDCNCNSPTPAPCCFDCPERQRCPDVCPHKETTFCVGVIKANDRKGISQKNNQD